MDLEVYKYVIQNIIKLTFLSLLSPITLIIYIVLLPFIWSKTVQKFINVFADAIEEAMEL